MNEKKVGSCLCKEVCFEIEGAFESFFLCHCKLCQKDTGSAHAANLFSTSAKIKWISGEDKIKSYNLPSTRHVKSFCEVCGSGLPNIQMAGNLLVVPAGSLDDSISLKPDAHIYVSSRADWDIDLDSIKKIDKLPS